MSFEPVPNCSKRLIRKSGEVLIGKDLPNLNKENAQDLANNWRAAHLYPMNTLRATLENKVKIVDNRGFVAQRLKRMPTIIDKLKSEPTMNLTTMHDIAGLRAVVSSMKDVDVLLDMYLYKLRHKHKLKRVYDYILTPKPDGYRSVHLVYEYDNDLVQASQYNGLLIEIQLRTKLQHAWATAVEVVGLIRGENFKRGRGDHEWVNFFSLVSSAFAKMEKTKTVKEHEIFSKAEIFKRVAQIEKEQDILSKIEAYNMGLHFVEGDPNPTKWHFKLLVLNLKTRTIQITSFGRDQEREANDSYGEIERKYLGNKEYDVVLVSAGPQRKLKRAYPNYFLDVSAFKRSVDLVLQEALKL